MMMSPFVFVLALAVVVLAFVYQMASLGVKKQDRTYNEDDTELLQELHKGLQRMEERVEALETILMDKMDTTRHKH